MSHKKDSVGSVEDNWLTALILKNELFATLYALLLGFGMLAAYVLLIIRMNNENEDNDDGPTIFVNDDGSEFTLPECTCGEFFCDRCQYQKEKQDG